MGIVEKSFNYKNLLHTHLVLGQTRWVCRYGTLGEGHENITPAQRYFQAIREAYQIACSIKRLDAMALNIDADLIEATDAVKLADGQAKLRAQSKLQLAELAQIENMITKEDQLRMLSEYDKIISELDAYVRNKYPNGIEEAQPDIWRDRLKYRLEHRMPIAPIPLPQGEKDNLVEQFVIKHQPLKQIGASNV